MTGTGGDAGSSLPSGIGGGGSVEVTAFGGEAGSSLASSGGIAGSVATMSSGGAAGSSPSFGGGSAGIGAVFGLAGAAGSIAAPTSCEERTAIEASGVFVDQANGSDAGACGGVNNPCKSIQQGVKVADQWRPNVYVSTGTYVETVDLKRGVTIEGGWEVVAGKWRPVCGTNIRSVVTLRAPEAKDKTVTAYNIEGVASLRWITVLSKPTAASGESLYGVFVTGSLTELSLEEVDVSVSAAGNGAKGADGTKGVDGVAAGGCGCSGGQSGATTPNSPHATVGLFDSSGYHPIDGLSGADGNRGQNGLPGGAGSVNTSCYSCAMSMCSSSYTARSGAGYCGCGGGPGTGGGGGRSGGSSIALYVWGSKVTLTRSTLKSGSGGVGGKGGNGGLLGKGSSGVAGTDASCATGCTHGVYPDSHDYCDLSGVVAIFGGYAGGNGGDGTPGGNGGDGAGGFSYSIYRDSGARVPPGLGVELIHGSAGTSLGNGASGLAGETN